MKQGLDDGNPQEINYSLCEEELSAEKKNREAAAASQTLVQRN